MGSLHIVVITAFILAIGFALFRLAMLFAKRTMRKKVSVRSLFKDFHQKMYMTAGLGGFFFSLYFFLVWIAALWIDPKTRLEYFSLVLQHPVEFIYLGLTTFATLSITIYMIRMVIKYRYNSKNWR